MVNLGIKYAKHMKKIKRLVEDKPLCMQSLFFPTVEEFQKFFQIVKSFLRTYHKRWTS